MTGCFLLDLPDQACPAPSFSPLVSCQILLTVCFLLYIYILMTGCFLLDLPDQACLDRSFSFCVSSDISLTGCFLLDLSDCFLLDLSDQINLAENTWPGKSVTPGVFCLDHTTSISGQAFHVAQCLH